jgi:hypothetical protein
MTDNQFYILITVIGAGLAGIGAAIRFSVGRVIHAMDNTSAALVENTKSNAILSTKIDTVSTFVQGRSRVSSEVKEFIREEISGVHDAITQSEIDADDRKTPRESKRAPSEYGIKRKDRG